MSTRCFGKPGRDHGELLWKRRIGSRYGIFERVYEQRIARYGGYAFQLDNMLSVFTARQGPRQGQRPAPLSGPA